MLKVYCALVLLSKRKLNHYSLKVKSRYPTCSYRRISLKILLKVSFRQVQTVIFTKMFDRTIYTNFVLTSSGHTLVHFQWIPFFWGLTWKMARIFKQEKVRKKAGTFKCRKACNFCFLLHLLVKQDSRVGYKTEMGNRENTSRNNMLLKYRTPSVSAPAYY